MFTIFFGTNTAVDKIVNLCSFMTRVSKTTVYSLLKKRIEGGTVGEHRYEA